MATLTRGALEQTGVSKKDAERSKNMFALGLLSWMYNRPTEGTERFLREKFAKRPDLAEANVLAFSAGHAYGETTESFAVTYDVAPAPLPAGTYRQITGNTALAYGIVAAGQASGLPVFLGSYPITPASDILHELSKHKALRRHDLPGRGRDRRRRGGAGCGVRRRAGRHHDVGPRDLAQERDDRAGRHAGVAAGGDRRAAGWAVDGVADQDRAVRPVAGDVRPQRRGSAADHRAALARRLLRRRAGGGADRVDLPDAGARALRRVDGQRLGAVADPGRRRRCRGSIRASRRRPNSRTAPSSGPTCATTTPSPGPGRSPARRGSSTASAAWRRPTGAARSPTTRTTTTA